MDKVFILSKYYNEDDGILGVFADLEAIKMYVKSFYNDYYDSITDNFYSFKNLERLSDSRLNLYYEGLDYPVDDLLYVEKWTVIKKK